MTDTEQTTGELTITRRFAAPPELIFDCMTTPEHLTHFWGPTGVSTPIGKITIDRRPGGRFETTMINDATGEEYPMLGVFVEFVRGKKLSWTERDVEGGMLTSVTFVDLGDGTTETITHQTNIPAMFLTAEVQEGLQSSFVRLDEYLVTLV
jgi:uncharacterized protein YndB with AHSA1/START domain